MSRVSVVIPSWNTRELLRECLASLEASSLAPFEVVVVDNASSDGSAELVAREFGDVHLVVNEHNLGYTRACNQGLHSASGDQVLLLNADARLEVEALARLSQFLDAHASHGAVAPRLSNPDGSLQRSIMRFPNWKTPAYFATPLERWTPESAELRRYFARDFDYERDQLDVEQPAAACLLVRRELLERLGGLDERLWLFFSDVDLCARIHGSGARIGYLADARCVHHLGSSTRQFADFLGRWHADRLTYYRAHFGDAAGVWVKACVVASYLDYFARNCAARAFGRASEPIAPVSRALLAFLER